MKYLSKPPLGAQLDWSNSLNKGLAGFWLFNEGHGDKVQDLSMNRNHGTVSGMAFPSTPASGWNPGRKGVGLNFDGTNDYVEQNRQLVSGYPFSFGAWIYMSDPIVIEDCMIFSLTDKDITNTQYGVYIGDTEGGRIVIRAFNKGVGLGAGYNSSASPVNDSKWHHVMAVFISNTSKLLYVDGVLQHTDTTSSTFDTGVDRWSIGRWGDSTPKSYFDGSIDEVRIYNRALSAKEIMELYINSYGIFL